MTTPTPRDITDYYARIDGSDQCQCHACIKANRLVGATIDGLDLPLNAVRMILCPECGNKRCPHASDHNLPCTGSNKSGQPGSVYA